MKPKVYIIDDDELMCHLLADDVKEYADPIIFHDAIAAINNIENDCPKIIFLDVLLNGPDGFTFLNEIVSYEATAKIPIVIITSLSLSIDKLDNYGVVKVLDKATFTPEDIKKIVKDYICA